MVKLRWSDGEGLSLVWLASRAMLASYGIRLSLGEAVPCPCCGHLARRIHSHYRRTAADLPWQGLAVRLELHVRRFWCDVPGCPRQIFAERLPGVVAPGARRSERLSQLYLAIGLALGSEAGTRTGGC